MKRLIFITLLLPSITSAAIEYRLLAPLPGGKDTISTFTQYVSYLFPFLLSFAAISALVMFILGSIRYILSAGGESTSKAKEWMTDAILGLLLAVFAVLILQTINPELVKLHFFLGDVGQGVKFKPSPTDPAHIGLEGGACRNNGGSACDGNLICVNGFCQLPPSTDPNEPPPVQTVLKCVSGICQAVPLTDPAAQDKNFPRCFSGDGRPC